MGTRSFIGIELPSGRVRAIYCHFDGYPQHHAPILLNHYNTAKKVRELLKLGSLSTLGTEIGEKHDMDSTAPSPTWCRAYHRDRSEVWDSTHPTVFPSFKHLDLGAFNYLFKDGKWWLVEGGMLTDLRVVHVTSELV